MSKQRNKSDFKGLQEHGRNVGMRSACSGNSRLQHLKWFYKINIGTKTSDEGKFFSFFRWHLAKATCS